MIRLRRGDFSPCVTISRIILSCAFLDEWPAATIIEDLPRNQGEALPRVVRERIVSGAEGCLRVQWGLVNQVRS